MEDMIKLINVCNVKVDNYPLNKTTLDLVDFIRINGHLGLPPIKVNMNEHGVYIVKDGRHRLTAYKLLEIKQILANISKRTDERKTQVDS